MPSTGRRPAPLSAVLQRAILLTAIVAMLLFGLPLAVTAGGLFAGRAQEALARDAEHARSVLTAAVLADPARIVEVLPVPHDPQVVVGVYDGTGRRIAGQGPEVADSLTRHAASTGVEEQGRLGPDLVTVVPLVEDRDAPSQYVVRAAEPDALVRRSVHLTWLAMAALAMFTLAVVAALGRVRARRIARPLVHLGEAAAALGRGDFTVRAIRSGVLEVDAASASLERTARRLGGVLERERAFSADASHQLRTPLTAMRMHLESALITPGSDLRQAGRDALTELDRLEQTVLDLLAVARDTRASHEQVDVAALVAELAPSWRTRLADAGRQLELQLDADLPPAATAAPALRTVLDVLLGNALTHGGGGVRLAVRADDDTLTVEVADHGEGVLGDPRQIFTRRSAGARGTGIGLALARSLVEADGGRLELTSRRPATFAVVLPTVRRAQPLPGGSKR